ncbi:anti-anti-sigma factor [Mycobacterium intermedium]|uniref:Anti-sigma factor antagonist n=2 Tax=Mycobacterium intermedium TaxID=28445 RepID=A0A1E3S7W6_MYCIE|nr:STAS domain-containing protein [Mycobacterium intermedium]ODQ98258.1 anti-anti-sigma factor [Mycobacterium intermedium]OPE50607.1 anti-anti-sigma factor [Mycobacterium intermedium]ORB09887.1 anti-anti-sigma factor [Mycobacterium intermedium]
MSAAMARSEEFGVIRRNCGETVVLQVRGALDQMTAPSLATHFDLALTNAPAVLVVDLTDVDFMSSAGITLLVEANRLTAKIPTALRVAADGPATARPLNIVGIDQVIDVYPTLTDAMRGR